MPVSEETVDYYQKYKNLKRKFKFLIYENECFQEELKKAQRKLLKISRDKSFLLDRLLQYESIDSSSSDSEATESSDSEIEQKQEISAPKKKKVVTSSAGGDTSATAGSSEVFPNLPGGKGDGAAKKKKPPRKTNPAKTTAAGLSSTSAPTQASMHTDVSAVIREDGHMTSEEIERHLEAKQALRDLLPEKAPLTVPVELFSTELSGLDSDLMETHSGDSPTRNCMDGTVEDGGLVIDLPE